MTVMITFVLENFSKSRTGFDNSVVYAWLQKTGTRGINFKKFHCFPLNKTFNLVKRHETIVKVKIG